jgi:hypothetical protein
MRPDSDKEILNLSALRCKIRRFPLQGIEDLSSLLPFALWPIMFPAANRFFTRNLQGIDGAFKPGK